jgi:hypothetical protein
MGYTRILMLVVVFLVAILLHWLIVTKEGFQTQKTPLTKEGVQGVLDEFVLDILNNYQKFNAADKSNLKIRARVLLMANMINALNDQYPMLQNAVAMMDYTKYTMINLEDVRYFKDFLVRRMGETAVSDVTTPVTLNDLDLFTARIQAAFAFAQQRAVMVQGGQTMLNQFGSKVQLMLQNLKKLKMDMPSLKPVDVPLLKMDLYWVAMTLALANFVLDEQDKTAPIPALNLGNLPVPQPPAVALTKAVAAATAPGPQPVASTAPIASTAAPTQTTAAAVMGAPTATSQGMKFSELIQTLISYSPIVAAQKGATTAALTPAAPTAEVTGPKIQDLVKDEVAIQLASVKLGAKDAQNIAIANRATPAVVAAEAAAPPSDGLFQGAWFRGAVQDPSVQQGASCPYANGQKPPRAEPNPFNPNDYIRKDSIPCWACTVDY